MDEQFIAVFLSFLIVHAVTAIMLLVTQTMIGTFFDALCWPIYFIKGLLKALYRAVFTGWKL